MNLDEIELNTDEIESLIANSNTLLASLTSITQTEFDQTQTLLDALTSLQNSKQDEVITLLNQLTANTDSLEINSDEVEALLSGSNSRLDALTAIDYATSSKQDSIITLLDVLTAKETTISLDVSAININTDEIEELIEQSNTLLDALTAKVTITDITGLETRLDVLTAVDYATSAKQDVSNTLFDSLTAIQVEKQDQIITLLNSISGYVSEVDISINGIESNVDQVETLLNDLTASNVNVPGFSIPPYDEINFNYVGSTDIFRTVTYLNNTTQVMSLSFTYITEPPTLGDAIIQSVKKI
jgi:putative lipoic acid-binding regulatory protein